MRLLHAELTKLTHHTAIRVVAAALVAVFIAFGFAWFSDTRMPDPAELQVQTDAYETALATWNEDSAAVIAECEAAQQSGAYPIDRDCSDLEPQREWYVFTPDPFASALKTSLGSMLPIMGGLGAVVLGLLGAGVEFSSGTMSTWLTVEPRRGRVFASKLGAIGIASVALAVIAALLAVAAPWIAYQLNDVAVSLSDGDVPALLRLGALALTAIIAGGLAGGGLGFALRGVVGPLVALLVYGIGGEALLGTMVPAAKGYLLSSNIEAWMYGQANIYPMNCTTTTSGYSCVETVEVVATRTSASIEASIILVVILIAGLLIFRRDVD